MAVNHEARAWQVSDPNEIVRCRSPQQQPFMRVRFPSGETVEMSFQLAEWLGVEAKSLRIRHAILSGPSIPSKKYKPRKPHGQA